MKNQDMQESFIEKLKTLRNALNEVFPTVDVHNLIKIMNKLAHYHYKKSKFYIVGVEKELYNFLIENSYNPYTVYRWLLLEKVPEDIKFRLKQNELTQKEAIAKACIRRHETEETLGGAIKSMGLNLVRGL